MSRPPYALLAATLAASLFAAAVLRPAPATAEPAPQFSVRAFDGKVVRLSDLRGHPVVLDFWATWCAPCKASMPHLTELQERYRERGLVVIGLSVDDGGVQKVKKFAERLGVGFRLAMADDKVLDSYGPIRAIPTTFFINRKGEVVRRVVGVIDAETIDGYVRELF